MKIIALLAAAGLVGGLDEDAFRYSRRAPDSVASGRVAFEPDSPLLAHAGNGLRDLRVVDRDGEQVPWRFVPEANLVVGRQAAVLNTGRRDGLAVALVDVGTDVGVYERVELAITGQSFVGEVTVLGSDSRHGRYTRLSTTTVYDVDGATSARSTTVVLPPTDFRFLALRASGVDRITGATVLGRHERPALVRRPHLPLGPRQRAGRTVVTLDLRVAGVPVSMLELTAAAQRYDRPITVDGSRDRRVFTRLARGRISRANGLLSSEIEIESRFRYLRVTVENGDDAPLRGLRAETFGPSFAVMVERGHRTPLRLLYGADLRAPSYEFARLPVAQPVAVVGPARLGPESSSSSEAIRGETLGERYGWAVQASLGVAALVVVAAGLLAVRRRA